MPEIPRRPPRPPVRQPSVPEREVLQDLFFEEYWEDRKQGITSRSMHEMLREHIVKDETHQTEILQRVTSLEANSERDAQDRANGTGRFPILPAYATPQVPPSRSVASAPPKSFKPWWQEAAGKSLKYFLLGIAVIVLTLLAQRLGLPVPNQSK